jgi:hypothetical protein
MSEPAARSTRERLQGKWQIPALGVALALLAGFLWHLRSTPEPLPFAAQLAQLSARVEDGFYTSAIDYGQRLVDQRRLSSGERAEIHLRLAWAHYLRAEREKRTDAEQARIVQAEYTEAQRLGAVLTAALSELNMELAPYRGQWEELKAELSPVERRSLDGMVREAGAHLRRILDQDEADVRLLAAKKTRTAQSMGELETGRRTLAAYSGTTGPRTSVLDGTEA